MRIGNREIGAGRPVYVVAEMSANHLGDFERAVAILEAAREAGADAIKLQTYTADSMTLDCRSEPFRIRGTVWEGQYLHDLYAEAFTPWEWQPRLKEVADRLGLDFFSTPFDPRAVAFLEELNVPVYKVASFELVDLPLLRSVARTGKPVILSTGMASLEEIGEAVTTIRESGGRSLALLKCVSAYPAPPSEMNLATIPDLARAFEVPVGLSDHTLGHVVAVAAVALGASILEKHVTLDREHPGPDSSFSLEPREFRTMVEAIREAEAALGVPRYGPNPSEVPSLAFRRSLFVVEDVAEGDLFTERNVRPIRPASGLHTRHIGEVLGRRARCRIVRGTPLSWEHVAAGESEAGPTPGFSPSR